MADLFLGGAIVGMTGSGKTDFRPWIDEAQGQERRPDAG